MQLLCWFTEGSYLQKMNYIAKLIVPKMKQKRRYNQGLGTFGLKYIGIDIITKENWGTYPINPIYPILYI